MNDVMLYGIKYDNLGSIKLGDKEYVVVKSNDKIGYLEKVGDSYRVPNRGTLGGADFNINMLMTNVIDNIHKDYLDKINSGEVPTKEDLVKKIGEIQNNINNIPTLKQQLSGNNIEIDKFKQLTSELLKEIDKRNDKAAVPNYDGISSFNINNNGNVENYLSAGENKDKVTLKGAELDILNDEYNKHLQSIDASTNPEENVQAAFNNMKKFGYNSENTSVTAEEYATKYGENITDTKSMAESNLLNNDEVAAKLAKENSQPYVAFTSGDTRRNVDYITNQEGKVYEFKHGNNNQIEGIDAVEIKGKDGEIIQERESVVEIDATDFSMQHFGIPEEEMTASDANNLLMSGRDKYTQEEISYLTDLRHKRLEEEGLVQKTDDLGEIKEETDEKTTEFKPMVKTLGLDPRTQNKEAAHIDTFILCLFVQLGIFLVTLIAMLMIK